MHCVRNQFFRDRKGLQPSALVAWTREDDQKEVCQFKSIGDRQYTECKYGGPLGRPGTSSMEARPVSMSVAAFP